MEGPDPIFVSVFIGLLLLAASALTKLFTREYEPEDETEEDYDVVETTEIYDNADANKLLDAKMSVLEWSINFYKALPAGTATNKAVVETARLWWDFIALKPGDDSDE